MLEKEEILRLLNTLSEDIESNKRKLKAHFVNVNINTDEYSRSLLHILVDDKYDQEKCYLAIKTLLEMGVDPNHKDYFKYNFIQLALYTGYSESFILKISSEAFKHGLNPNHQDEDLDTVIHSAIYSEDYFGGIEELLKLYIKNGFNTKITCENGNDISNAVIWMNEYIKKNKIKMRLYTQNEIERIKDLCSFKDKKENEHQVDKNLAAIVEIKNEPENKPVARKIESSLLRELEKYGTVLNIQQNVSSKAVGREDEILRLMVSLAKEETTPILVGESGVGKTAIADELACRLSIGAVPKFLQGKIILEIDAETINNNTKYSGEFETKILSLMKLVEENDVILLINEIHTIYGIGTTDKNDRDLASIIKKYIDRKKIKVIGTTTQKEYTEYFSKDALKRRFDVIKIKEPDDDLLYTILEKTMIDYEIKKGIQFKDESKMREIIEILMEVTKSNHRKYDDKLCNPALAISIIDEAFANAAVFEDAYIEDHHFINAINWCERIYPAAKEKYIAKLKENKTEKKSPIILQFKKQ